MKSIRKHYTDADLGEIYILSRTNARHITMRVKSDGIYVTAHPLTPVDHILEVLDEFRSRLKARQAKLTPRPIYDFKFKIETDCFQLHFQPTENTCFTLSSKPGQEIIYCPSTTDFRGQQMQEWLHKVVCEALRKQAKLFLPQRLAYQAKRCGLDFNKVSIRSSQSRWGSCSSQKNISLSWYLMTLPLHLIDAVLIHELCHTVEMNHGPRFWALMDKFTNGQSRRLQAEIKRYRTEI